MRVLVAYLRLEVPGGTEVYSIALAEQLERLGHHATLVTWAEGAASDAARGRELSVTRPEAIAAGEADVIVAGDAASLLSLAARVPDATRIMVMHSTDFLAQTPPQLPGAVQAIVALNDRVARRAEALALPAPVVRLRQPIELDRFRRLTPPAPTLRRVALFGGIAGGGSADAIPAAVRAAGLEPVPIGLGGATTTEPERELARTDAVLGIGRCALEGLAARRPVLLAGPAGVDGWVTPETFDRAEADGFSGRATPTVFDPAALSAQLAAPPGRAAVHALYERVEREHDAAAHAEQIVALARELGAPPGPVPTALDEISRLTRIELRTQGRAEWAERELRAANVRLAALGERLEVSETLAAQARDEVTAIQGTTRWRLAGGLLRPFDRLRRRRGGGRGL